MNLHFEPRNSCFALNSALQTRNYGHISMVTCTECISDKNENFQQNDCGIKCTRMSCHLYWVQTATLSIHVTYPRLRISSVLGTIGVIGCTYVLCALVHILCSPIYDSLTDEDTKICELWIFWGKGFSDKIYPLRCQEQHIKNPTPLC